MGSLLRCATPSSSTEMAVSLAKVDGIGRVPAARGRAVALRVEPLSKAHRLAPSGGHPSRWLAATLRARWRAGWRRTADHGPCRCANQCSDQDCAFIAMQNSQVRPAMPAVTRQRPVPVAGARALIPSWVRERGPLDELTGLQVAALCSARCGTGQTVSPVTRHARCPGPLNAMK